MKDSAYIRTQPDTISFSLPHNDRSGIRLQVWIGRKKTHVNIIQDNGEILIPVDDIEWLRQTLDDIKSIIEMNNEHMTQPADHF